MSGADRFPATLKLRSNADTKMTMAKAPSPAVIDATIAACIANAEKLEAESYDVEFREPPTLQLFVLLIAQEEYAKAFLLLLVRDGITAFTPPLLRAMNDHACKQLVGVIMDYIVARWETMEDLERMVKADVDLDDRLPPDVESAVLLLRYEKIGRWKSDLWDWVDPPDYDATMQRIAKGKGDRRRQDALYVRVGADGRVCSTPSAQSAEVDREKERLTDYRFLIERLTAGTNESYRHAKAMNFLREVFAERVG